MKIYVDMDGVLADFRKGIYNFCLERNIELPEKKHNKVLLKGTNFFDTLDVYPSAVKLVDFLDEECGGYHICSSPLRDDDENSIKWKNKWLDRHMFMPKSRIYTQEKHHYAHSLKDRKVYYDTREWDDPGHYIKQVKEPNILIDDRLDNCANWVMNGGIAIRYVAERDDDINYVINLVRHYKQQKHLPEFV